MLINVYLTVCSYHIAYAFQSESTLYSCLNVKELLAWSRHKIWSLSNCNSTWTHNHLVHIRILNHLAKLAKPAILAKWLSICLWTKCFWVQVQLQSVFILNVLYDERIRDSSMKNILLEAIYLFFLTPVRDDSNWWLAVTQ